jgi:hypothetical protein
MQKIMFNDQYGLTQAVLDGRKTQTRRIAYQEPFRRNFNCGFCTEGKDKGKLTINDGNEIVAKSHYKIGEVLAVAQRYEEIPMEPSIRTILCKHPGWNNKMFVTAKAMPHQIKIINIRVQHLQDISTDDCMKEGIICSHIDGIDDAFSYDATNDSKRKKWWYDSPNVAYWMLCNKLHLIWNFSTLVFVYDFELVK